MEPGLQVGDFVLVNKSAYGIRLPAINKLISKEKEPKRGEVAVFLPPHTLCEATPEEARPELSSMSVRDSQFFLNRFMSLQKARCTALGTKYIKRVIGLPGDKVEIRGYEIFINDKKIKQELLSRDESENLYLETINGFDHIVRILGTKEYENFIWEIPPNKYLAIGDNRDNSLDSRDWGYFSKEHLIGRGEFIWLHWGSYSELPHFQRNRRIK
jgi:signal peptidase I